ncbi:MAG: primosomal protein N' [Oscillospiraceae bacterium]|nr:primosomal protein N' [Oscillospiraceae bacterium]
MAGTSRAVAKIAVSAATYWIDRPYDYLVPEELAARAVPGVRVYVPFARGNRRCEGIILAVTDHSDFEQLKTVLAVLDEEPVLNAEQIRLALFMRERFFCTVYDAVKTILPAGVWLREDGTRRVRDKTVEMARLRMPREEAEALAEAKRRRSPKQAELLELLCSFEALPSRDLLHFTASTRQSLQALCRMDAVELYAREVYRRPETREVEQQPLPVLNEEQLTAFSGLNQLALADKAGAALLFGVTGSGKTSVYIHLIHEQLRRGKSAILLVPEIALTPQMLQTFSSHFGDEVALLHSSLSPGERYDEWKRLGGGKAHLAIGTRSAVFAPVRDLGLIIMDEEQEETYKSENAPRYHARDVAKFRCARAGCLLLLGSATPDIASRYQAEIGKYAYFSLPTRYNERELPAVRIVDMKRELRRGNAGSISSLLKDELQLNIERGEQSILFLNRRGAHKLVSCGECGYTFKCPRCSIALTYHSATGRLMCHYCGFSKRLDAACPDCGGQFCFVGAGTQLVEEELHTLFGDIPIMRMDTDTVTPAGSHERLLERFREENIPILVGTQMVTKGLNFENVTLVGVISADQSLYAGDYRAGERTFSLITQVVGRSGRGEKPGRAVIQTFTPANETIRQAAEQDYEAFYRAELELRRLQETPPFRDLLAITASGLDEGQVVRTCRYVKQRLRELLADQPGLVLLGPTPLAVVRVNLRYRYRVNISCRSNASVRAAIAQVLTECGTDKRFKGISVFGDNDPSD